MPTRLALNGNARSMYPSNRSEEQRITLIVSTYHDAVPYLEKIYHNASFQPF